MKVIFCAHKNFTYGLIVDFPFVTIVEVQNSSAWAKLFTHMLLDPKHPLHCLSAKWGTTPIHSFMRHSYSLWWAYSPQAIFCMTMQWEIEWSLLPLKGWKTYSSMITGTIWWISSPGMVSWVSIWARTAKAEWIWNDNTTSNKRWVNHMYNQPYLNQRLQEKWRTIQISAANCGQYNLMHVNLSEP